MLAIAVHPKVLFPLCPFPVDFMDLKKSKIDEKNSRSQDDPFFITAALLSGPRTGFVSRDLLRGHRFKLQDEQLIHLFQRWQWQHQWKVLTFGFGNLRLQVRFFCVLLNAN